MNLMDLFIKIGVKDSASSKIKQITGAVGDGLKSAAKTGVKAIGIATTGIATMAGMAIKNYAEYEQLVGGVETLFKNSADTVQKYASIAYKTAGMSANEYMDTVTSFSASLLQSLGGDTAKAAEYADMAIIDMSDNANKMGTSMESIQFAYQGFAKQNYTMLDNLKLGYGGTKTEMERLIEDANTVKLANGEMADLSIERFGDVVEAIHIVQTEMGITGTTAAEASSTISGSVGAMKAAWKNLLTGIADNNADFGALMDNFVEATGTALNNILPRAEIALNGVASFIEATMPMIAERIPQIITDMLPRLIEVGVAVISAFANGLINALPQLIQTATDIILQLINKLAENPDQFVETAIMLLGAFAMGIAKALPEIIAAVIELMGKLIISIIDHIPQMIESGKEIIDAFIEGIKNTFGRIVNIGSQVVSKIREGISNAWEGLKSWFNGIWNSLFGGRNVHVGVSHSGGGRAGGLDYVPANGFPSILHKGEAVLTRSEAEEWRKGKSGSSGGVTIIQNIQAVAQTPVQFASATEAYFEQARWAL